MSLLKQAKAISSVVVGATTVHPAASAAASAAAATVQQLPCVVEEEDEDEVEEEEANSSDEAATPVLLDDDEVDVEVDVHVDDVDVDVDTEETAAAGVPARPKRPSEQFCRLTDRMKRLQRYVMWVLSGADSPDLAGRFSTEDIVRILKLAEPVKSQVKMLAPANPPTRHMPGAAELPVLPRVVKPVPVKPAPKKRKAAAADRTRACKKHVLKFNPDEPVTDLSPSPDSALSLSLVHPDKLARQEHEHEVDICIVKPIRIMDQQFLIDGDNLLYSHIGDDPRPIGKLVNNLPSLFC